jgi:hypothetical protein
VKAGFTESIGQRLNHSKREDGVAALLVARRSSATGRFGRFLWSASILLSFVTVTTTASAEPVTSHSAPAPPGEPTTPPSQAGPDGIWRMHLFGSGAAEFEADSSHSGPMRSIGARIGLLLAVSPWLAVGPTVSFAPAISLAYGCSQGPCNSPGASMIRGMVEGRAEFPIIRSRVNIWFGLVAGVGDLTGLDQSAGPVVQVAIGGDLCPVGPFCFEVSPRLLAQDVAGVGSYRGALFGAAIDLGIQIGSAGLK